MRAFTLLEAMLALAISGIVVASATVATVGIYRSLIAKEQQADADDQGRAVVDYLGGTVARLGNDYVVPAAVVSNDCWSRKATRPWRPSRGSPSPWVPPPFRRSNSTSSDTRPPTEGSGGFPGPSRRR